MIIAQTMTEMWATMGSTIASFMFIWALIYQYRSTSTPGDRLKRSEAYAAVEAYLSINSSKCARRLKAEMAKDCSNLVLSMDEFERVKDEFQGIQVWWVSSKVMPLSQSMYPQQERRFYRLTFHRRNREIISEAYLKHVMQQGRETRVRNRQRKLYTNGSGNKWQIYKQTMWNHIVFRASRHIRHASNGAC
ncbi:ATP BINDING PROTEIN [Salix viminalis]|uniref:ATP BINDING PROTEIN n=1 Tax=Salix viminalis TaxID=40686 RepID=A0A9Q0SGC7_SALVM|nr:ATP BINDING PROTEIN [Salix viminalis]